MLRDKRIIFVCVQDKVGMSFSGLTRRVMAHEKRVRHLLSTEQCLVGRVTQELTGWKSPNLWVATRNVEWTRNGVATIGNLDDVSLVVPGDRLYVLGGSSVFAQLHEYVDEYMLYTVTSKDGDEPFHNVGGWSQWVSTDHTSDTNWSYAHLVRRTKQVKKARIVTK